MKPIEFAIVRMLLPVTDSTIAHREAEGVGFLIDNERHILSCEHVVSRCRLPLDNRDELSDVVEIDFPFTDPPSHVLQARIDYTIKDDKQDVAGLTLLSAPPTGAYPATLIENAELPEHRFRAYGVSGKDAGGQWSYGVIRPGLGDNYIYLEATTALGRRVRKGYSGTAVYDLDARGVAGMVVKADTWETERVAVMLPTRLLLTTWSEVLSRAVIPSNPYKALEPFNEGDADLFFGREDATLHFLQMVETRRFGALIAGSGAGKSSLLRAGLMPALSDSGWAVVYVNGFSHDPYYSIARALISGDDIEGDVSFDERCAERADSLAKFGLEGELAHYGEVNGNLPVAVIIDQMEELFTNCRDQLKRRAYLDHLVSLTKTRRRGETRIAIVVAAREDFRARLEEHKKLAQLIEGSCLTLDSLTEESLRRAIEQPALEAGVRYEAGVVDSMVNDVKGRPNSLPLLEYALTLLWSDQARRTISREAYDRIGGVDKALAIEAERAYDELTDEERQSAERIFVQLTNLSPDSKGTRRPITQRDLIRGDWDVVEKLSLHMLVTIGLNASGEPTAHLAHESLIGAWPRLTQWVDSTAAQVWRLDRDADRIIRWHVVGSAAAAAIPWGDIAATAALYASMGHKIGKAYGVEMNDDAVKRLALSMAQGVAAVAIAWLTVINTFKMTGVGYVASWFIEAPVLAALTYAVGNTWQYYFRIRYLGGGEPSTEEIRRLVMEDARNRLANVRLPRRLSMWRGRVDN